MKEKLLEVDAHIKRLMHDYPDLVGPFLGFIRGVEQEGALDVKTKKLIAVSLAVAQQCEWCIAMHTKLVLDMVEELQG